MELSTIQIDPEDPPDCAIIWLHGLGASGHDFEPMTEALELPASTRARFIFPHAPVQAVHLNDGMQMPAWYDIYGLDANSKEDQQGLQGITRKLNALIAQQVDQGIKARRIILAGFSQGGALALYAGLHHAPCLAGILALSCYLPLRQQLQEYAEHADRDLPIFLAHGEYDEVVPLVFSDHAKELLEQAGFSVHLQRYPCAHTVCTQEIADIRAWLLQCWETA